MSIMYEPYIDPKSVAVFGGKVGDIAADLLAEQEDRHKTGVCVDKPTEADRTPMPPDIYGVNRTRFSTWDRVNLERLAEELVAELNATKEELRVALKAYRKSVKDCDK